MLLLQSRTMEILKICILHGDFQSSSFRIWRAHSHLEPWLWSTLNCNALFLQSVTKLTQCNFGTSVAKGYPIPLRPPFFWEVASCNLLISLCPYCSPSSTCSLLTINLQTGGGSTFNNFCNLNLKTRRRPVSRTWRPFDLRKSARSAL
jgi:hypothetical protein